MAVSGGADSMCLAHALHRVAGDCGAKIFLAHVNHQLRGEEADGDARFVCAWAREHNIPRLVLRVNLRRQGGQSLENVARQQRYRALILACQHFSATKLMTAHHADDQVETFLLNLLRGSGGRGLQGIPKERPLTAGIRLLRPLLPVTRKEIEDYCHEAHISWRTDATNDSLSYQRNRIRLELLPLLRDFNPGIDGILLNTIEILQGEQILLDALAAEATAKITVDSPLPFASLALSARELSQLPPALQNRVILAMLPENAGVKHVEAVLSLLEKQTGMSIALPGGQQAYRLHDSIALGGLPPDKRIPDTRIPIPGTKVLGNLVITVDIREIPDSMSFWLPEATKHICVSSRKPGDYFYPPGGGKKLKDYMIDRKVPRWLRNYYPVFRSGDDIFWVAGLARDQRFSQSGPGKKQVYINLISGGDRDEQADD
jgi:tRNA(Ile)-lysidine synthase